MPTETTADFRAQDWMIIVEALMDWAWPPSEGSPERVDRAWELVDAIAFTYEMPLDEFVMQVDEKWQGP